MLRVPAFQETLHAGMCGPAVLKMVLGFYGIEKTEEELAKLAGTTKNLGTDDAALQRVLESFGLRTIKREDFMKVWFDFTREYITSWDEMIIRQLIAVEKKA